MSGTGAVSAARLRAVPRPRRARSVDLAAGLAGVGLGVSLALGVVAEDTGTLHQPGGPATAAGRLAGLAAGYLLLVTVVLAARLPLLERAVGQDQLLRWHRRLGPWPLYLLAAHVALVTLGYAQLARTGVLHQTWVLVRSYPDVLAAAVGTALLVMAGATSYRRARRRMRHETWWAVHLYVYLGLALAFAHQVVTGSAFVGHPLARLWWSALWAGTAASVLVCRVGLPLVRSLRHRLRVVAVRQEAPGVVSVVCQGRRLERLEVSGGQFLQWRFLRRGLWWQAHPYSLSALPHPPYLRVTIKALGDHSGGLAAVRPGTWVAVEGPYGVFTPHSRAGDAVLLVGAGVGVTPLRALLEDLPRTVDVVVVLRASTAAELPLRAEMAELVARRGGRLHELLGPRSQVRVPAALQRLVPDLPRRDVYVCGPDALADEVVATARAAGTPEERIHHEAFAV